MKKTGFKNQIISILIFLLFIISCSNSQESKLVYTESNTIKQSVKDKEQEITWTQELEEERLSERIRRDSMELGSEVVYNTELFKILKTGDNSIYPSLEDFGSLNTSSMELALKEKINKFCEAFASENHTGAEAYFNRKYLFNYIFLVNDLNEGIKANFKSKIKTDSQYITKWILGEPFIGADIIQIPVRFFTECGTIDMTMFLKASGNFDIYYITIDRWNKV